MNAAGRHSAPESPPCRETRAIFLRSLALQASWNPQRMQNLGLLTSLLPWLRRQGMQGDARRRFCRDHIGYFNTNPYLANYLIGGLIRLESESVAAGGGYERTVRLFKESLGRALASLGDQLFWLGLQPALVVLACLAALGGGVWLTLGPFVVFAIVTLAFRLRALEEGYRLGLDIVELLDSGRWHRLILLCKRSGALLTGVMAGIAVVATAGLAAEPDGRNMALGIVLACGAALALRRRIPAEALLLLLVPLAMLLADL